MHEDELSPPQAAGLCDHVSQLDSGVAAAVVCQPCDLARDSAGGGLSDVTTRKQTCACLMTLQSESR